MTRARAAGHSESDLLRRAADGDEDAFRTLYRQFQGPVYRFALHMGGAAAVAEDITQEVFMTLIEKQSRFDAERGTLRSYLIGMARNLLLRRFDREQKFVALPELQSSVQSSQSSMQSSNGSAAFAANHPALPSVAPADLVRSENIERVREAVLSLPADYRETVVLCELQEFSYEEAAAVLGCPVGTIRSRLHRARTMLAEKLREFAEPARSASAARSSV